MTGLDRVFRARTAKPDDEISSKISNIICHQF